MKECLVNKLMGNEILEKPICLEDGNILIEAGTVIKQEYKELLLSLNIKRIFVKDSLEEYEKPNYYFEKSVFLKFKAELQNILSQHIYKDNKSLRKLENLAEEIVTKFEAITETRALDITERTDDIYEHSLSVTLLVLIMGKEFGFSKKELYELALGGLLHDLGYRYVNVDYKNCCEKEMTPMEIYELKKHTILAYTALEQEHWIPQVSRNMVLFHHERLDGSGYPLKQKSKELECRMIQICDSFDCAICGMECKKKTLKQAFEKISDTSRYDSRMLEILQQRIGFYPVGTYLTMDNGKKAVVISQTENAKAPIVLYYQEEEIYEENLNEKHTAKILEISNERFQ